MFYLAIVNTDQRHFLLMLHSREEFESCAAHPLVLQWCAAKCITRQIQGFFMRGRSSCVSLRVETCADCAVICAALVAVLAARSKSPSVTCQ